ILQVQRLPEKRRREIPGVALVQIEKALIVAKQNAALFERRVQTPEVHPQAAAKQIRHVAQVRLDRILIRVADEIADGAAETRIARIAEVGHDAARWKEIELRIGELALRVVGALAEQQPAIDEWIRVRGQRAEIRGRAMIDVEAIPGTRFGVE